MARTKKNKAGCHWKVDEDGNYDTDCGEKYCFIDDGPIENGMKFCCYCGAELKAKRVEFSSWMRPAQRPTEDRQMADKWECVDGGIFIKTQEAGAPMTPRLDDVLATLQRIRKRVYVLWQRRIDRTVDASDLVHIDWLIENIDRQLSAYPDADIVQIQTEWLENYRATRRWIVVEELDGFSVHEHSIAGVFPSITYPTKEAAAARILQLLDLKQPVTPVQLERTNFKQGDDLLKAQATLQAIRTLCETRMRDISQRVVRNAEDVFDDSDEAQLAAYRRVLACLDGKEGS